MPPRYTDPFAPAQSVSNWFGSLRPKKVKPNPTVRTLRQQVHFSPAQHNSDSDTPSPTPAATPLIKRRMKTLLTQPPTSQNRAKAVHYITQHPGTPHAADLRSFASSHYKHPQICFTPRCSLPHRASEFQSAALTEYTQLAQTLVRRWRWNMELGNRFLQYAQHTEASLLQHFYKRIQQCYTRLRTSIATMRRRIIMWRRQGTFLLDYYNSLVETCNTKKEKSSAGAYAIYLPFWGYSRTIPQGMVPDAQPLIKSSFSDRKRSLNEFFASDPFTPFGGGGFQNYFAYCGPCVWIWTWVQGDFFLVHGPPNLWQGYRVRTLGTPGRPTPPYRPLLVRT